MRLLISYFLRSFFASDPMAPGSDPRAPWIAVAAILAVPAVLLYTYLSLFGSDPAPELGFYVALGMIAAGLVAALAWDALLPSRTDFRVLGPLPLRPSAIAAAKLIAVLLLLAIFEAAVNSFSSLLLPSLSLSNNASAAELGRHMAAQFAATAAGSLASFFLVLGLLGLALAMGGEDSAPSRILRGLVVVFFVAALALAPDLTAPHIYFQVLGTMRIWARPLQWFLAVGRETAGADPRTAALATQGLRALAVVVVLALAAYSLAAWRLARSPLPPRPSRHGHLFGPGVAAILRHPEERAIFRFGVATLTRSPMHAAALSAWVGAGIALALANLTWVLWQGGDPVSWNSALLAVPLVLCFFALVGLRQVLALPADLEANWIFRLSEWQPHQRLNAAWNLMFAFGLLPALAVQLPLALWLLGARAGLETTAVMAALGFLLLEMLLLGFCKVPFTCAYVAGRANLKLWWMAYWLVFTTFSYRISGWEYRWRSSPTANLELAVAVAAAAIVLARYRRHRWGGLAGAQYEDRAEPVAESLLAYSAD